METTLPKYRKAPKRQSTTVRLSTADHELIQDIRKATESPSFSWAVSLLLSEELSAVNAGIRSVDSFVFSDEKRPYIVPLTLSTEDRERLDMLKDFYKVDSMTNVISHLIKTYGRR